MAFTVLTASASTLKSGVVASGLEDVVNTLLVALLNHAVTSVEVVAADKQRRSGKIYEIAVTYDDAVSTTVLTNPFELVTFTGATQSEAQAAALAFRALQPAWFYADPIYRYISEFAPAVSEPHVVFQFYSEDANGTDNWLPTGGGGTTSTTTALVQAVATTVGSVVVDDVDSVTWDIDLENEATGDRESWTVTSNHDGSTGADATATSFDRVGQGPVTGTITLIDVVLSGVGAAQVMELQVTCSAAGWQAVVAEYPLPII